MQKCEDGRGLQVIIFDFVTLLAVSEGLRERKKMLYCIVSYLIVFRIQEDHRVISIMAGLSFLPNASFLIV